MSTVLAKTNQPELDAAKLLSDVVILGDLSRLDPKDKVIYYNKVCESLNLNPLTRPFEYMRLNGKEILYVKKDATEQMRRSYNISIEIKAREVIDDIYCVTATASNGKGRVDESIGAINIAGLKGEAKANAFMKAETKAKRRVTLSIIGLGMLDESEVDSLAEGSIVQFESEAPNDMIDDHSIKLLRQKIIEADSEEIAICNHLKIDTIEIIKRADYALVMRMLAKKIAKKKQDALPINQALGQTPETEEFFAA